MGIYIPDSIQNTGTNPLMLFETARDGPQPVRVLGKPFASDIYWVTGVANPDPNWLNHAKPGEDQEGVWNVPSESLHPYVPISNIN